MKEKSVSPPNEASPKTPTTKQKALFSAVKRRDLAAVRELIQAGVDIHFVSPHQRGYAAMTPLMEACFQGHIEIAQLLLERTKAVDTTDDLGATALYYAVRSARKPNIFRIVNSLLERGANPNHKLRESRAGTVFVASIRKGMADVVRSMLIAGADVNPDIGWSSPLIEAANIGEIDVCRLLTGRGADVNAQTASEGWTALMSASNARHIEMVKLLLEEKADPNLWTKKGETALTLATNRMGNCFDEESGNAYLKIVKLLVEAGADLNVVAPNGWTPMDFAEYNPMKGHESPGEVWFGKGAEYLRSVGAKRTEELSGNQ
jgi:ankyrin repeat protein